MKIIYNEQICFTANESDVIKLLDLRKTLWNAFKIDETNWDGVELFFKMEFCSANGKYISDVYEFRGDALFCTVDDQTLEFMVNPDMSKLPKFDDGKQFELNVPYTFTILLNEDDGFVDFKINSETRMKKKYSECLEFWNL